MDQLKLNKKRQGEDKDLRRARDQFNSPKTQRAIREAILAVGATDHDGERILVQLGDRLRDYKHLGKMRFFRPAVIAWVTRQAHLNVALRELLQQPHSFNPTLLFTALPGYTGEVGIDALRAWAESVMQTEAAAIAAVPDWAEEFRKVVYHGIWSVLKHCTDLGVGTYHPVSSTSKLWHPVVEEVAAPIWEWVWKNAYDLAVSPIPISIRLWRKARRQALAWRTSRIENRRTYVSQTTLDAKRNTLEQLMQVEDRGDLTEVEQYLLQQAEEIGVLDFWGVDRVFKDADGAEVNLPEDDFDDPDAVLEDEELEETLAA